MRMFILVCFIVLNAESLKEPDYNSEYYSVRNKVSQSEINCLAQAIYFEARGLNIEEKIAVAFVVLNRTKSKEYPNSICKVVWQKTKYKGNTVAQFSFTNNKLLVKEKYQWQLANSISRLIL